MVRVIYLRMTINSFFFCSGRVGDDDAWGVTVGGVTVGGDTTLNVCY
jgi:hypothetical protein